MHEKIPPFPSRAASRRSIRGFTLLELMAVVIIVGILAAIAIPQASKAMRERRSSSAAHRVALMYQLARARSIGRGAAVLVRYDTGVFRVREAIVGTNTTSNCQLVPIASCTMPPNRWNTPGMFTELETFALNGQAPYELVQTFFSPTGSNTTVNQVDICFTPGGTMFTRASQTGAFRLPQGELPYVRLGQYNGAVLVGIARTVFIMPNGIARVGI